MPHAILISKTGGPEVLAWQEIELAIPAENEVRVRHTAIGLNFIDTVFRRGIFPLPSLPGIIGAEGAGVVLDVGRGVTDFEEGDRVVYSAAFGSYCEERNIAAERLVDIPDGIDDVTAAGAYSKGTAAEVMLRRAYPHDVGEGTTILVHAVAGGVGSILSQWASYLGATVIGTVGSDAKAELARANGVSHVINYTDEDFVARVSEITDGAGVSAVFDSVGLDTFTPSLDCLSPRGFMISFGAASGPPPQVDPSDLMQKGSLFVTRVNMMHYLATRKELLRSAADLFGVIQNGSVSINVNHQYKLADAAQAHTDLADRKLSGSTVLIP